MKNLFTVSIALALLLAACAPSTPGSGVATAEVGTAVVVTVISGTEGGGTAAPFPTPEPPTPIPPLPSGLSPIEAKYRLLEEFPDFFFCDPDLYPVAIGDEEELARQRFPEIQANTEEFQAILNHNGMAGQTTFTDEQKLLIYREHKKLAAIMFELNGDKYLFQIQTSDGNEKGFVISGLVNGAGQVQVQDRQQAIATCPICLAAHTQIDTPNGPVAVENLRTGDPVWTVGESGSRIAATVLKIGHVPAPAGHQMVHILLEDGRELWASPGHPTADSRVFRDLKAGDLLDGSRVKSVERVAYDQQFTYDLLPSGGTGFYWANGILIGSTLANQ